MSYPQWLYHKDLPQGKIFNDADEELKAGEGWVDHPLLINVKPKITAESKIKKENLSRNK